MKTKIRLEGFTLTVKNVKKSIEFYTKKFGFDCIVNAAPNFAMLKMGDHTIGLLSSSIAKKEGATPSSKKHNQNIHVELSTDDLDGLYEDLKKKGVKFITPPHDEPWERSATALDPDGYAVEIAQGKRGKNTIK
jgi:uncharacterized glyoxalase superfamily protein PhnB